MDTISKWILAILASFLAGGVGGLWKIADKLSNLDNRLSIIETRGSPQFQLEDQRLTRVEERQKYVIGKLDEIAKELKQHESEGKKP